MPVQKSLETYWIHHAHIYIYIYIYEGKIKNSDEIAVSVVDDFVYKWDPSTATMEEVCRHQGGLYRKINFI